MSEVAAAPTNDTAPASDAGTDSGSPVVTDAAGADDSVTPGTPWGIFLAGAGAGLLALFMPCIFPMIPLTVSFFTKQSKTKAEGVRKALIYGLSINFIYVALGLLITALFGSSTLNELATNPLWSLPFPFLAHLKSPCPVLGSTRPTKPPTRAATPEFSSWPLRFPWSASPAPVR